VTLSAVHAASSTWTPVGVGRASAPSIRLTALITGLVECDRTIPNPRLDDEAPADDEATALLGRQLIPLYIHYIDDHITRLRAVKRYRLADSGGGWIWASARAVS
jgi:hypothetical protein